jgi:hypothetical protein
VNATRETRLGAALPALGCTLAVPARIACNCDLESGDLGVRHQLPVTGKATEDNQQPLLMPPEALTDFKAAETRSSCVAPTSVERAHRG